MLDAVDLARFRDYVAWTPPEDDEVQARAETLSNDWAATAYAFTQRKLSEIMGNPTSLSVPDYSEGWGSNVSALQDSLKKLGGLITDPDLIEDLGIVGFSTGVLIRPGRSRWPLI